MLKTFFMQAMTVVLVLWAMAFAVCASTTPRSGLCTAQGSVDVAGAKGTLKFPAVSGASVSLEYRTVTSQPPARLSLKISTCSKHHLSLIVSSSRELTLTISRLIATLPSQASVNGSYVYEIFDGNDARSFSEEIAAKVQGRTIVSRIAFGFTFRAGHTYLIEVVAASDLDRLPKPVTPPPHYTSL